MLAINTFLTLSGINAVTRLWFPQSVAELRFISKLQDHGYRASVSCGMPVYYPQLSLVFTNRLRKDSTLSCRWYTVAASGIPNRDLVITSPARYVHMATSTAGLPYSFNAKKRRAVYSFESGRKYWELYVLVCPRYAEQHLT